MPAIGEQVPHATFGGLSKAKEPTQRKQAREADGVGEARVPTFDRRPVGGDDHLGRSHRSYAQVVHVPRPSPFGAL